MLDYESRFRETVIEALPTSYAAGETPVPCIECNRSVKFRDLLTTARELGASALATGHYVASRRMADGSRALVCAADADRDQSYFLFATTREQLDYLRFPLGDMTKPQTRELARRFGLSVADKQDSQDICFVPTGRYTDIVGRLKPNALAARRGRRSRRPHASARHQGIAHFTVGQRRGLGIASSAPLYVIRLDAASRRVVVGPREALRMHRIVLRDVNWIGDGALDRAVGEGLEMFVRVRSTRAPQPAWLRAVDERLRSRTGRRRGGRVAGPGLRILRCGIGAGARARRRVHQERGGEERGARIQRAAAIAAGLERTKKIQAGAWATTSTALGSQRLMAAGRRSTISYSARCSSRAGSPPSRKPTRSAAAILDVGVGTGLSLSDYSRSTKLCGVDISEPMLRKAQQRVRAMGLSNVETLAVMDAKNLAFADSFFDAVVAQYVITAVPDPESTLDDFIRVLKPGGELILVNHIGAESGPRRMFELAFAPLARRLGWRPEFPWARLVDWAAKHGGVSLTERRPMAPMGHFSLIRYRKS